MIIPSAVAPQTTASSSTSSTTSSSGLPSSQSLDGMFLQLLVAQLQNQDPTQPLDPSTFVGQLAQFSELSEVTQIEQMLQNTIGSSGTGTSNSANSRPATSNAGSSTANNSANSPTAALSHMFTGSTIAPGNVSIPLGSTAVPAINFSSAAAATQAALPNLSSPAQSLLTHRIEGVF